MNPPAADVRIWGIVPAAGVGRRMGGPKQILPYGGSTIAATVVSTLLNAGIDGVIVVTRTDLCDRLRLPHDPRIRTANYDAADSEMLDSICIGLSALPGNALDRFRAPDVGETPIPVRDGVLVVPADMPMLTAAAVAACIAAYRPDPTRIVIAGHAGMRGHPVILPAALLREICPPAAVQASVTAGGTGLPHPRPAGGLRALIDMNPARITLVETGDPGVAADIDTWTQYEVSAGLDICDDTARTSFPLMFAG